ncbi:MAG TPA: hypothetical protein VK473_11280 [Terriglobales bacterium]|nr:hypothetical protein [Terriglobales bacterium]
MVITPTPGGHPVYLGGFGHNRIASAVHDPLYARCLALEIGHKIVVLCSADLIGLFYEDVLKIRRSFQVRAPAGSQLVIACTHVHEGPDTLGLWGPSADQSGVDPQYLEWIEERIATSALDAVHALQPARIELARDDHPLLAQLQSVDRPPYVKDPYLFVMRLVATAGDREKTIATLVNWSDHPETLNRKNTLITADYARWICLYLEQHYGGTALFFNRAVGKVSTLGSQVAPLDPETGKVAEDGAWRKPELLGTMLGQLSERALQHAESIAPDAVTFHSSLVFVPLANNRFRVAVGTGIFSGRRPLFTGGKPDSSSGKPTADSGQAAMAASGRDLETEVDYITLKSGKALLAEFVTIPGEIFPELVNGGITRYPGADFPDAALETPVHDMLQSQYQFVLGLGNDEIGYLIPKAEWDEHAPWLQNNPEPYYGEINSAGPDTAAAVLGALSDLIAASQH